MDLLQLLTQAQNLKIELDQYRPLPAETEARILQKLRLDWNYHSNHIEGGRLSYGETKALLLFGITAQGKPLKDHLEVSGHDDAIKWIEEVVRNEYPLVESFIRQLHEVILKSPYTKKTLNANGEIGQRQIKIGEYKTTPNHVLTKTGEMFYFASPEETPALMHDLMEWYNAKRAHTDTNGILLASEFHYKFIRIHPFDDGNGRIARLLMNFILMQYGFPPAIVKTEDKENYYSALEQADAGMLEPFLAYIAQNVIRSLEIMLRGAKGESIEEPDDIDKQISLLEQKLKQTGNKIEQTKTEEALTHFRDNSLLRLVGKFVEMNEKFKGLYVERIYKMLIWKNEYTYETGYFEQELVGTIYKFEYTGFQETIKSDFEELSSDLCNDDEAYLEISCYHNILRRLALEDITFVVKLRIKFNKAHINILGVHSQKSIKKLYHQDLTDEEMGSVLKAEAEAHLKFIQETIEKAGKEGNA